MKAGLEQGFQYAMEPISDTNRLAANHNGVLRGNHKSAALHPSALRTLIHDDVNRGYTLPITVPTLLQMKDSVWSPMGVVHQSTIDEHGAIVPKSRGTHDQTFQPTHGKSVNDRISSNKLVDCTYGYTLRRILHAIVAYRLQHPHVPILISKIDFDKAYRRVHVSASLAAASCFTFDDIGGINLRMNFGNKGHPSGFSTISDTVCDVANTLLNSRSWNVSTLFPTSINVPSTPSLLQEPLSPVPACPLCIDPAPAPFGQTDGYIDDLISVCPSSSDNATRIAFAVPIVLEAISRPVSSENLPRSHIVSLKKLKAEGCPSECQTVLGWRLNTRALTIALPEHKCIAWLHEIDRVLHHQHIQFKHLETLIGRLVHVTTVVPFSNFFLSRLYRLQHRANRVGPTAVNQSTLHDLSFWKIILRQAQQGIPLNLLTYREPTHCYKADACEIGLGGYSLAGRAWRWKIPTNLQNRASINLLELLASIVGLWIDQLEQNLPPLSCCLCESDSTSATAWLCQNKFNESEQPAHFEAASKVATIMMEAGACIHPQWIPGSTNIIADCLSRDFDLNDMLITQIFFSLFPLKTPLAFKIAPLPNVIVSWLTSLLQNLPELKPTKAAPTRSTTLHGLVGKASVTAVDWGKIISSSRSSTLPTAPTSSSPSLKHYTADDIAKEWLATFRAEVSAIPSARYRRPSDLLVTPIHASMPMESNQSFYTVNTVPMPK